MIVKLREPSFEALPDTQRSVSHYLQMKIFTQNWKVPPWPGISGIMVSVLDILPRRPSGGDYKLLLDIKTAVLLFVTLAGNLPPPAARTPQHRHGWGGTILSALSCSDTMYCNEQLMIKTHTNAIFPCNDWSLGSVLCSCHWLIARYLHAGDRCRVQAANEPAPPDS